MTDLIIGLCFGIAAAIALLVMWRMAARLHEERLPRDHRLADEDELHRDARGDKRDGG